MSQSEEIAAMTIFYDQAQLRQQIDEAVDIDDPNWQHTQSSPGVFTKREMAAVLLALR